MSAVSAPFGLRPSFHPSGLDRAIALANGIASAYNTGILKGQPVALNTSGNIIAATAGSAYQGAFAGHEFTDVSGRLPSSSPTYGASEVSSLLERRSARRMQ